MNILGLDCGSSSVKAGIVRDGQIIGPIARATYPSYCDGPKVEVDPGDLLKAIARAIADLGRAVKRVDAIGLSVMSPAWIAMLPTATAGPWRLSPLDTCIEDPFRGSVALQSWDQW